MKIVSLFSGCGGLDLGFKKAGFNIIWANEFDKDIWVTYEKNHPETILNKKDIRQVSSEEIPDCVGIIGGPPCQSWSEAGTRKGISDERGQLFFEYIRILKAKKPLFFLAENVSGMFASRHKEAVENIISLFTSNGYCVSYKMLSANNYNVPQERRRVFFIGYRKDLGNEFEFPPPLNDHLTVKDAIWDLKNNAIPTYYKTVTKQDRCIIPNHEYLVMGFSSIYMSRNRTRSWDEVSYTIQAGGRHAPIHPQANKMIKIDGDKFKFDENSQYPYRSLSVRECARIQTFPDDFIFYYDRINTGYKMIGNAVPVNFANILAIKLFKDLKQLEVLNADDCAVR